MANSTKLFYTVAPNKVEQFNTSMSAQKVIGFVEPTSTSGAYIPIEYFGYIIAGGKQYGISTKQLIDMANQLQSNSYTYANQTAYYVANAYFKDVIDYADDVAYASYNNAIEYAKFYTEGKIITATQNAYMYADQTVYSYYRDAIQYTDSYTGKTVENLRSQMNTSMSSLLTESKEYAKQTSNTAKTEAIKAITVDGSKNSLIGDGGAKYTFTISNGKLSVSKYLATTLTARTSPVYADPSAGTSSNTGEQFIGTTYTLDPVITISESAIQQINYTVSNPTGNEWAIVGIKANGGAYIMGGDVSSMSVSGGKYEGYDYSSNTSAQPTYYLTTGKLGSSTSVKVSGTVAWAAQKTVTATIPSKQFTVYLHEANTQAPVSCTVTLTAQPSSSSVSVKAKANWYKHTSAISAESTGTATVTSYPNMPSSLSVGAGNPSFAYPKQWNKKPTFRQLGEDTGWVESAEISINGVQYRVFNAPSTTGSTQEYTITWA